MPRQPQAKNFTFTYQLNHEKWPGMIDFDLLPPHNYCIYQHEIASTGQHHWQGYVGVTHCAYNIELSLISHSKSHTLGLTHT